MKDLIKEIEGLKLKTHPEETEYRFGFRDGNNACVVSVKNILNQHNIGELSDGYHTFNSLYEQRMYLFATIVNQNKDKAWKSFKHEDGELCFGGGWFIVGVDTPKGSYTYHYENKYWNLFECQELECGKHWDGHTDKDVNRMLSLADYNIITAPKQIKLSKILGKLNNNEWKDFQITSQENVISIDNNNNFRQYFNIDKGKITDISEEMQTNEYKWLYALWIAGSEIIDDLEEKEHEED